MAIPLIVGYYLAVNCVMRAPAITRIACFAVMQPHRSFVNKFNVVYGADFRANSAAVTVLICSEASVR